MSPLFIPVNCLWVDESHRCLKVDAVKIHQRANTRFSLASLWTDRTRWTGSTSVVVSSRVSRCAIVTTCEKSFVQIIVSWRSIDVVNTTHYVSPLWYNYIFQKVEMLHENKSDSLLRSSHTEKADTIAGSSFSIVKSLWSHISFFTFPTLNNESIYHNK